MAAASGLSEEVLERLASDPMSCVERVARTAHIALSPASLGNLKAGVAQYFSSHINRYHPALHGILLGYRNPKLMASTGSVLYDQPHIHVDVTADFYMFTPAKGSILCGIVNKKNFDRIVGCLVHQTFNVSLMGGMQSVTRADNKEGSKVKIEVTRVNYGRDSLPFIQGKLLAEEEGELVGYDSGIEVKSEAGTPTPTTPVAEKRKREEEEEQQMVESIMKKPRLENEDLTPTSKKGKKSKHVNVKEETEAVREDIKQESEVEPSSKKKKKKKDDVEVEIKQEPESSDIVVKKKKKKKNKERESDQIMSNPVEIKEESGLEEEATKIKKKSKKNKS